MFSKLLLKRKNLLLNTNQIISLITKEIKLILLSYTNGGTPKVSLLYRALYLLIYTNGGRTKCFYNTGENLTMSFDFGLIRLKEVIEYTTLSRATIYRRLQVNNFPPKINCGGNIAAWKKKDIIKYVEQGGVWA